MAPRLCDAEGGILFGARIATLDGVVPGFLAAAGDRRPVLTALAERLLALEVGEVLGGPFGALVPGSGAARSLTSALRELRQAELGAEQVWEAAGAEPQHRERLGMLASALDLYQRRLADLGALDGSAAQRALAESLARGTGSEEVQGLDLLVIDGFRALGPPAFDVVCALSRRARRTHLRLPYFPERPDVSAPVEALLRRFEGLHELAANRDLVVGLEDIEAGGLRAPRLACALRAVVGGAGGGVGDGAGFVAGAAGPGEEGEAEVAARFAARLMEEGFAPEDIALFACSGGRAAPRLARACAARGIPLAVGRGVPLADEPAVRAVLAALLAAERPSRAALEAVAASPYVGLTRPPSRLGFLLDRAGALEDRGDPVSAMRQRAAALRSSSAARERTALLRSADALEELLRFLKPLAAAGLPREHAARLRMLVTPVARRRAARGEVQVARHDLAVLAQLEEVADELVRALALIGRGGQVLPAERWRSLLALALDGAALPTSEPAGGAIELWSVAEAPGLSVRAAIVVGCARGAFPSPPPPEQLLRDPERLAVNRAARRAAIALGSVRRAEALHAAFCALAAGREALALVWPGPGPQGTLGAPAPLAVEALLAAGAEVPPAPELEPGLAGKLSEIEAMRAFSRAAREGELEKAVALAPPQIRARISSALARGAMESERRGAVLARRASRASGAVPEALLPDWERVLPSQWSPSELETHARCPFRLFGELGLGLREPEAADLDIDPRDEGQLAHAIMERFLRARLGRGAPPLSGAPGEQDELRRAAAELFAHFEAEGRTGDGAVWPARRDAVLRRLERVIAAEGIAASRDPLEAATPTLLEYCFGGQSGIPPLVLSDGEDEVLLRGRIDRVDASARRILVIDYKDSRAKSDLRKKLSPEAIGATNFQLPTYLLAAARALPGRPELEATYLLLRSAERLDPMSIGTDQEAGSRDFARSVLAAVRRIRAGELPVASRDCGGCALGAVCRFQSTAEKGA